MGAKSAIEWTDATWTPIRARVKPDALEIAQAKGYASLVQILEARKPNGELRTPPGKVGPHCEHISPGCEHCYSETNGARCLPANGTGLPFDRRSRDLVELFVDEGILDLPFFRWRKPRKVFVCSQTDLFGEFVTDEMIDRVFLEMAMASRHTFQVLTKRPQRMRDYLSRFRPSPASDGFLSRDGIVSNDSPRGWPIFNPGCWPLPNVWLGVSVEDQQRADERIPLLLQTPAALRFLSVEPLLGPVDLWCRNPMQYGDPSTCQSDYCPCGIDWVIAGGESGPGARPMHPDWARSIRDQCLAAHVPFFFKQWGEWQNGSYPEDDRKTRTMLDDGRVLSVDDTPDNETLNHWPDYRPHMIARVGKHASGALLDGREWKQMPEPRP